jgi:WD40 repeat protein
LISSLNNQIQVLDLINEIEVSKYTGHNNCQYLVDMKILITSKDDILLLSGSEDNKVYVWNVEDGLDYHSFSVDQERSTERILNCLSLSSSSDLLATSSFSNTYTTNTIDITTFLY